MSIERKNLVSGALLAFVAVTGLTLAVKETRHARAVAAAEATRAPEAAPEGAPAPPLLPAVSEEKAGPPTTIVVTYFHSTARCVSCLKIEDLTNATMSTRFAGPIAEKRVIWRTVNTDEPASNHFVKDYGLYTKSVVVSEVKEGREVRWKNLEKVWDLLGDPAAFQTYVAREVQVFLDEA